MRVLNTLPNGVRLAHHNTLIIPSNIMQKKSCQLPHEKVGNFFVFVYVSDFTGQRIFPVGMMGKALAHIRHIE